MTGVLSDHLANGILDQSVGDGTMPAPATAYLTLCKTLPVVGDTGATLDEPDTGTEWTNYARVEVTDTNFNAAASRKKVNSQAFDFGQAATSGDLEFAGWALVDNSAVGAGNVLWVGAFSPALQVQNGDTVEIAAGAIELELGATFNAPT